MRPTTCPVRVRLPGTRSAGFGPARGACRGQQVVLAVAVALAVVALPQGSESSPFVRHGPAPALQAAGDTYVDPAARRLVEGARVARDSALLALDSYTVRARERHLWQFVAPRSSYVLQDYQQDYRFHWARDDAAVVRVDAYWILHPALAGDPPYASGLLAAAERGLDPYKSPFRYALAMLPDVSGAAPETGEPELVSPLDPGAEQFYRYRSGDTVTVAMPGGATVRAVAVTAVPRTRAVRFVVSQMWIEAESFGLVRLAFRPAKPADSELVFCLKCEGGGGPRVLVDLSGGARKVPADAAPGPGQAGETPASEPEPGVFGKVANTAFRSIMPRMELGVAAVVADYALWDARYWLPRSMTLEAAVAVGDESVAEEEAYEVSGGVSSQVVFEVEEIRERGAGTETAAEVAARWRRPGDTEDQASTDSSLTWRLWAPDSLIRRAAAFAHWEENALQGGGARERIASELAALESGRVAAAEASPWTFEPPILTLRLLGYSREEGFSAGTRLWRRFAWGRAVVSARMGTVLTGPQGTVAVEREFADWRVRAAAWRDLRLAGWPIGPASPRGRESRWYAADGISLRLAPARRNRESLRLRVYAERHDERTPGARETRAGAGAVWTPWWGGRAGRLLQAGGEVSLDGSVGGERTLRAGATAVMVIGRDRPWSLALEGGGARTWGGSRRTDPWLLDESGDWLRGHPPAPVAGAVVWRGRVDLQRRIRLFRLSGFADWATVAGSAFRAAGAGLVLPGGIRFDVARGLAPRNADGAAPSPEWRTYLRFDSRF